MKAYAVEIHVNMCEDYVSDDTYGVFATLDEARAYLQKLSTTGSQAYVEGYSILEWDGDEYELIEEVKT